MRTRFRDVMVSIPGFEPGNPGSNPGGTSFISVAQWKSTWPITRKSKDRNLVEIYIVRVAQWIAHQTSNLGVAGSNPVMDIYVRFPESGQRGAT